MMKRASFLVVALVALAACELFAPPPAVLGDGERREGGDEGEGEEGEGDGGEGEGDAGGEGEGDAGGEGEGEGDGGVGGEGEGEGDGPPPGCQTLVPPGVVDQGTFAADVNGIIQGIVDLSPTPGTLVFEAYAPNTIGTTFDLASSVNDNFSTCSECVRLNIGSKDFFQASGSGVLNEDPLVDGHFDGEVNDVVLVEVTFGAGAVSTPVPGGDCFELANWTFDFTATPE